MAEKRILYVEDEKDLSHLVSSHLRKQGYDVDQAFNFSQALVLFQLRKAWDLILLDLYLPDGDGLELLKLFRQTESTKSVPVIILSARSGDMNRIKGLELGADDYLEKPFSLEELTLRVKKTLDRDQAKVLLKKTPRLTFQIGEHRLILDQNQRKVILDGEPVSLSPLEFKILFTLAQKEGEVVSRDELISEIWNDETAIFDRTVDAFVAKIRKKLGPFKDCLETARGFGYRFKLKT